MGKIVHTAAQAAHAVSEDQHEGGDAGGVESTSDGDESGCADPG